MTEPIIVHFAKRRLRNSSGMLLYYFRMASGKGPFIESSTLAMNASQIEDTTDLRRIHAENASEDESVTMGTTRDQDKEESVDEALEVTEADAQGDAPKTVLVDEIVIVSGHVCCHRQCVHILTELSE
jgi:hypothetical protein